MASKDVKQNLKEYNNNICKWKEKQNKKLEWYMNHMVLYVVELSDVCLMFSFISLKTLFYWQYC